MAQRVQTIDFLISRMEKLCDIENDQHLSSPEKFEIMNSAIAETWDAIIDAGLGEKWIKSVAFNTVAGQQAYPLFTIAPDFYRVSQVYVNEGNGQSRPIRSINQSEIQMFRPPQTNQAMVLYYVPYSPILTTGQTFDGINGWEEHTLMTACAHVKMKREEDYSTYNRRKQELVARMRAMGKTDLAEPPRVARKRKRQWDPYMIYVNNINCYMIRGDAIELFYNYGYVP